MAERLDTMADQLDAMALIADDAWYVSHVRDAERGVRDAAERLRQMQHDPTN